MKIIIAAIVVTFSLVGFYFGQSLKECPPIPGVKTEPKIVFKKSSNRIVQEVLDLGGGRMNLTTTAWSKSEIIYRSHISEHPTRKEVWHKGELWFVPKITYEVKKAEHERAQRASDEYLEKIKRYEP